ncbi:MAG: hypothetical protein ACRC8Y_17290 [Chroococcales cyanobacterium]
MAILLSINSISGPLPLPRGGLGWGLREVAIADCASLFAAEAPVLGGETSFLVMWRSRVNEDPPPTHSS